MNTLSSQLGIHDTLETDTLPSPEPAAIPDGLLTVAEGARLIGQHRQALWVSVQRGHIPTVSVNGKTRLRLSDIKAYDRRWRRIKFGRPPCSASTSGKRRVPASKSIRQREATGESQVPLLLD